MLDCYFKKRVSIENERNENLNKYLDQIKKKFFINN